MLLKVGAVHVCVHVPSVKCQAKQQLHKKKFMWSTSRHMGSAVISFACLSNIFERAAGRYWMVLVVSG